jgi:uncharacterized protein YukE
VSFEGMDVDELDGLAKQIDSDTQKLYDLVTTLNGALGELVLLWHGPVATTFEQDWQAKNRPALLAAYNTLSALHKHLMTNISQQSSASAADGGWTVSRAIGDAGNVLEVTGLMSLVIPALEDVPVLGRVLGGADLIGDAVSGYDIAKDGYEFDADLIHGHYVDAANDMADELSTGLKAAPVPYPWKLATFGAGVDVKLLDEVANLDWKDTPSPFSGSNFEQDYVPEFKSMGTGAFWEQAGKTLFGAAG